MCEVVYDGDVDDPLHNRGDRKCLFGDLVNGYTPATPHREEGSGVFWRIDRPEGLTNPFPYGWICNEHHEELLLHLISGPIVYDMACHYKERGKYEEYLKKAETAIRWNENLSSQK